MALALNCAFGQNDISELRLSEVDFAKGYICRNRSKTGIWAKYKLWPVTLKLIEQHRSPQAKDDDDRVFLNKNGAALVKRTLVNDRLKVCDAVKNAFWRLQKKTAIDEGRTFYSLRKTAASGIELINPMVTEMFLAHSERGMKRHYAQRNWAALDEALVQLGDVYRLKA
jgi:integrase